MFVDILPTFEFIIHVYLT